MILSFFLLASGLQVAKAQNNDDQTLILNPQFVQSARQAIDSVYNFNYPASVKILQPWMNKYPKSPLWQFWKGLHIWWEALPDLYNKKYDKKLVYQFSKADYMCSKILSSNDHNLDALIIKAASNAFLARYYANRDKWLTSLQYGKKAVDALFIIKKIDPTLPDIQFGLGIYNYYTAFLPKEYPVLKNLSWVLPKGDRNKGIHQLREAADSSAFVQPESIYFLGRVYLEGEKNMPKALQYFSELARRYNHNTYYKRILLRVLYENDYYYQVITLADSSIAQTKRNPGPFSYAVNEDMYAFKGLVLYQLGSYKKALDNFKKSQIYSLHAPDSVNRMDYLLSGYYLGNIYQKMNEIDLAEKYYKEVGRVDSDSKFVTMARKSLNTLKKR